MTFSEIEVRVRYFMTGFVIGYIAMLWATWPAVKLVYEVLGQ